MTRREWDWACVRLASTLGVTLRALAEMTVKEATRWQANHPTR